MDIKFEEKFEEILKEQSEEFDIDWSLVEINYVQYVEMMVGALPISTKEYMVRMIVKAVQADIQDGVTMSDIDDWFKSHKFAYAIFAKQSRTKLEHMNILKLKDGNIKSIAEDIHDIFLNFKG